MTGLMHKVVDKSYLTLPYQYTKAQEITASAIKPLHKRKRDPLGAAVLAAIASATDGNPSVEQWRVLADAANIAETMLTLGLFDDPDRLFTDAVNAVAGMGRLHGHGLPMLLDAEQQSHLVEFGEAYVQLLAKFCISTVVVEPDGTKIYRVEDVDHANPITLLQGELLALVGSVRFVEMEALPPSGDMSERIPAQKHPATQQNLQELRKFLRLDRRARR